MKRYKEVLAVDRINLTVNAGDVYGFLGPNGAGKTTTLRMALGLIVPTDGVVELFGRDPMHEGARALEGVAGFVEAPRFYPYMTGRKNLELLAALDGDGAAARIDEVLDTVDLAPRAIHRVGGYSHGMRQLILRLAGEGITVLLSSHQLPEVQELCDRVAIVNSGRVVYEGALSDLRRQGGAGYRLRTSEDTRALQVAREQPGIERALVDEHGLSFQADERTVGELSLALGRAGVAILALTPELATLEDLFFRLTEQHDGDAAAAAPARDASSEPLVETR
ncbi:MAG TPA: ATP-binding cassette domain-containing protein [Solirubrobacterales bacterium]|nr:ATP-binding cassette domain-containing protein [Solirubrobacterales bacterium]